MNRPQEQSYFMTPDSLRSYLNLMEKFYEEHTSQNKGFKDSDGLQYAGVIENFGSEILAESNKLEMRKPPVDILKIGDKFKFYFDIQYSEYIETYEQQRMLCAVLKKDSLIPTWEYTLTLTGLVEKIIIRSESSSDPVVNCDRFMYTTDVPTLTVTDDQGNVNTYNLFITDGTNQTVYYFPINLTTDDMYDSIVDGTLTININQFKRDNVPYLWFCIPSFEYLPSFNIDNNIDFNSRPLLTIGNDGHDIPYLFPLVQGMDNVPTDTSGGSYPSGSKWFIKVYGDFTENTGNNSYNYSTKILKIEYIYSTAINETPSIVNEITYDDTYMKLMLSNAVDWHFRRPVETDSYGYDSLTYNNITYAYIELFEAFEGNVELENLISAFKVAFDESAYIDSTELNLVRGISGTHIDLNTDYSDHSIYKYQGVIHDLSMFDGLPPYLKKWGNKTEHRGHVEMYSIRDNVVNNQPTNRQTAAIILDTAVPQNDIRNIDLSITIKYQGDFEYDTVGESESSVNYLSEIGYLDKWTVANVTQIKYKDLDKFIYHNNGIFSLTQVGFDPALELGRGYLISNDKSIYENNNKTNNPKAPRTVARICDIPTSYMQITDIHGISPTYPFDKYYVRQKAALFNNNQSDIHIVEKDLIDSFNRDDLNRIWNDNACFYTCGDATNTYRIFSSAAELEYALSLFSLGDYVRYLTPEENTVNLDGIYVGYGDPYLSIFSDGGNSGGKHYVTGDEISFMIGGYKFNGNVTAVDGHVTNVIVAADTDRIINIGNFRINPEVYDTTTITGRGTGLKLVLTFSTGNWASLHNRTTGAARTPLYAFVKEPPNIWIYKYNTDTGHFEKYQQFSGIIDSLNYYDTNREDYDNNPDAPDKDSRSDLDVYLYNLFYHYYHDNTQFTYTEERVSDILSTYDITGSTDYSETLSEKDNLEECYSYLKSNTEGEEYHLLHVHHRIPEDYVEFPANHYANTFVPHKSATVLTPVFSDSSQPELYYYNPGATNTETFTSITSGIAQVTKTPIMFSNTLPETVDSNNKLRYNIYSYSLWNDYVENKEYIETLKQRSYQDLLNEIRDTYGELNNPVRYDGTVNQFTQPELVNYISERRVLNPSYKHQDTILLRMKNETVFDPYAVPPQPVGEQPHGAFTNIFTERFNPNMKVNGSDHQAKPLMIFKINGINNLEGFKMYDEDGNDISSMCMLIFNNSKYIYANNSWINLNN